MLGIKYSEAMRKLYGHSSEGEFPDVWSSWMDCALPENRSYAECVPVLFLYHDNEFLSARRIRL